MAGLTGAHTYSQVWKPSALLASQSFTSYLSLEAWTLISLLLPPPS